MAKPALLVYSEMGLYKDAISLLKDARNIIRNSSKDDKKCFGNDALIMLNKFILTYRKAFDTLDPHEKRNLLTEEFEILRDVEVRVNVMRECYVINLTSAASWLKKIASMERQVMGWRDRLDKRIADK